MQLDGIDSVVRFILRWEGCFYKILSWRIADTNGIIGITICLQRKN